jgi:hypothetical protein
MFIFYFLFLIQNKIRIVVNGVQQPNLRFGFFHGSAFGQGSSLFSFGFFHTKTVFSGNFANNIRHYKLQV